MPYIKEREKFDLILNQFKDFDLNVGELNYIFSQLLNNFVEKNKKRYTTLNSVIGVLECCKLEIYRRVLVPYEDEKKDLNGDVF